MTWPSDQTLHVAVAYTNPLAFNNRRLNMLEFRKHMAVTPNVKLYVGEGLYNDSHPEVTDTSIPTDFQFRIKDQLWHKENMINVLCSKFSPDWKYGAYVDGDLLFTRFNWATEAIKLLQHHHWIQLFSSISDLDSNYNAIDIRRSFMYNYTNSNSDEKMHFGAPGGAWAFRREAFNTTGGLLDTCILGAGDHHMMMGLIQLHSALHPESLYSQGGDKKAIEIWRGRAATLNANIGFLPCHINHLWHGAKTDRGYGYRWEILIKHKYDPYTDLFRDSNGLYQLDPKKFEFREDIRRYFGNRNEDAPTVVKKPSLVTESTKKLVREHGQKINKNHYSS